MNINTKMWKIIVVMDDFPGVERAFSKGTGTLLKVKIQFLDI